MGVTVICGGLRAIAQAYHTEEPVETSPVFPIRLFIERAAMTDECPAGHQPRGKIHASFVAALPAVVSGESLKQLDSSDALSRLSLRWDAVSVLPGRAYQFHAGPHHDPDVQKIVCPRDGDFLWRYGDQSVLFLECESGHGWDKSPPPNQSGHDWYEMRNAPPKRDLNPQLAGIRETRPE